MLTLSVEKFVQITGAELLAGPSSAIVNGLAIDTRDLTPGGVFVAFPGEHADGHAFLDEALMHGARALVVTNPAADVAPIFARAAERDAAVLRVNDALATVQALAAYHRSRLNCPVVGVTGSTGKTTTKDFLASVLGRTARVICTQGNRNNELGVPLTIFDAGPNTEILIVEMGMRGTGQIAALCEIAKPTIGLVTNIGMSHVELLGSPERVAEAKAELVSAVPASGAVFLNGDDVYSDRLAAQAVAPVTYYGLNVNCDICAGDIELDAESRASFALATAGESIDVTLPVPGRHNVYNALAAAAVALYLETPLAVIADGLASAEVSAMRMEMFTVASGITIINDAYNANPVSMRAAIETLVDHEAVGKRIAVLGDMAELGSLSELAHFRIGEEVARLGIDVLVTVGDRAKRIADGAKADGMDPAAIRPCVSAEEASEVLDDVLAPGDVVLVKASRVMGLERVVEGIVTPRA
ncbi:MAG: UDP-N-acetylmuramoyl-tripeptide--D-alanyl-D-alanine ligase [Actinomycetota bacterium]|nr:UDP-N-acetylmuramoyl-tripeptide--D-alanyl-D-alanine ligase [Actinomycetota bacterium]